MATTRKILGQSAPAAATSGALYTVPAATDTVVSSIVIACTGVADTFYIGVASGSTTTTGQANYLAYAQAISAGGTVALTLGITLAAACTIVVRSTTGNCSFNAFGQENT